MTFSSRDFLRRFAALTVIAPACAIWLTLGASFQAASPVQYRFTFPEPEHHWMQVDVTFTELGSGPLEVRMSRSSPGRYSTHDFAKNVYDVTAKDANGRALTPTRPDAHGWTIAGHGGTVHLTYKVFGDRVDGTYLAIDPTHAHLNMPASIMWGRGFEDRPATLTFTQPPGGQWRIATQLMPGADPLQFTAPNLQYLMDSPVEFSALAMRTFIVDNHTIRFALHHTGTDAELDAFVTNVEKIVRVQRDIFGELPAYEPGYYTFLADYLPYASGDGMEHRNSTVITSAAALRTNALGLLDTVAHEFIHGWNVERIRPRSLEPFNFEQGSQSGELWLAEGFTQYYGPLSLSRAGLTDLRITTATLGGLIDSVAANPARMIRSAVEMSRMAVFTDGGRAIDRTNWPSTVISYYSFGGAIAVGLDLSLREKTNGKVTLDDFMRAMWRVHGKPGGSRPGYVDRPYTLADAERQLALVSGDERFARDFFSRYIEGHEVVDYARLLNQAGIVLRKRSAGRAWWGDLRIDAQEGLRVTVAPQIGTPAYAAGLDLGDEVREVDGRRVTTVAEVNDALARHRPGESLTITFVNRSGAPQTKSVALIEDPHVVAATIESTGGALTAEQKTFRENWLGAR